MPWEMFGRRWLPITLLVLAVVALFGRLGIWQLDRLAQRRASNARIRYITSLPPAALPSNEDLVHQEFRRVRVEGQYDFNHQIALRNQVRGGEYGFHLLTPLLLKGGPDSVGAAAVLVDRGWIPAEGNERPEDWRKYDIAGPVAVTGVVRIGQPVVLTTSGAGGAASADAPTEPFSLVVDPARMSQQLNYNLAPFYVQAGGPDNGTLPIAELPSLDLSEGPHFGYAVQWFGFALILAIGYPDYVRRQERSRV